MAGAEEQPALENRPDSTEASLSAKDNREKEIGQDWV